jgi:hypothetical protein
MKSISADAPPTGLHALSLVLVGRAVRLAQPQAMIRGRPGVRIELAVTFEGGRKHLSVVTLRRVA